MNFGDFSGGPFVKTLPLNTGGTCLIPGQGIKFLHASWPKKKKNVEQKQYCNKFNKGYKNGPNQKKNL